MIDENDFKSVVSGLLDAFQYKTLSYNKELVEVLKELKNKESHIKFTDTINWLIDDLIELSSIVENVPDDKYWIYEAILNGNLSNFVGRTIKNNEGSCCYYDKESFVFKKIKLYIETGENQSLYAEYKDEAKQSYWSPKCFKDTDDVLDRFKKWYYFE